MGNVKEESWLRCLVTTVKSREEVPLEVFLPLIWLSERPVKSNDAAVKGVTKAGSRSFLISYSYS